MFANWSGTRENHWIIGCFCLLCIIILTGLKLPTSMFLANIGPAPKFVCEVFTTRNHAAKPVHHRLRV